MQKCSGFDIAELKGKVKEKEYSTGYIGECKKHKGKAIGFLNGERTVCDTKEAFFAKIAEIVK